MVFWRKMASFICFITKSYKIVIVNGTLVCFTSYSPVTGRIAKCPECYSSSSKSIRKSVRFSESSMASFSDISPFFDFSCKAARAGTIIVYYISIRKDSTKDAGSYMDRACICVI